MRFRINTRIAYKKVATSMHKFHVGYTQGTFDMFHVGHLNLLLHAKEQCDILIVGVNSDNLVFEYKNKRTIIRENDRRFIIENIKCVDECIIIDTLDKTEAWNHLHYDAIFIGDDWKGNLRWQQTEKDLEALGAQVVYLPHTQGVSSTMLRSLCEKNNNT